MEKLYIFNYTLFSVTYFYLNSFLYECSPLATSTSLSFNAISKNDTLKSYLQYRHLLYLQTCVSDYLLDFPGERLISILQSAFLPEQVLPSSLVLLISVDGILCSGLEFWKGL